ncbi:MAG: C4-dicarboxylate ABC transporter permease, partial [Gammaproteobacteria bacterium]
MDKHSNNVQTPLDKVIEWIGEKLSVVFLLIVAITFYEVSMRYIFNSPTIWVHELAMFLGGSLFVVGGAYALANDKHVRVVLIY